MIADSKEKYEGLRSLWCDTFGDAPELVDKFFDNFGEDIIGYVAEDEAGAVCSAAVCYKCGTFEGRDVYVTYAVCTRPESRGQGIAHMLVAEIRDEVLSKGGLSLVSPADASLIGFYEELGYKPLFYAMQSQALPDVDDFLFDADDDEYDKLTPKMEFEPADEELYNRYREAFLVTMPHIHLSEDMMKMVQSDSMDTDGSGGLYVVNRGDAICAVTESEDGLPMMSELILSPVLAEVSPEIEEEIALAFAGQRGMDAVMYRTPGMGMCQAMLAGYSGNTEAAYFGFPID